MIKLLTFQTFILAQFWWNAVDFCPQKCWKLCESENNTFPFVYFNVDV